MTVKLLTVQHLEFLSLKDSYTGSSESTLVKMAHCWKSQVTAHTCIYFPEGNDRVDDQTAHLHSWCMCAFVVCMEPK